MVQGRIVDSWSTRCTNCATGARCPIVSRNHFRIKNSIAVTRSVAALYIIYNSRCHGQMGRPSIAEFNPNIQSKSDNIYRPNWEFQILFIEKMSLKIDKIDNTIFRMQWINHETLRDILLREIDTEASTIIEDCYLFVSCVSILFFIFFYIFSYYFFHILYIYIFYFSYCVLIRNFHWTRNRDCNRECLLFRYRRGSGGNRLRSGFSSEVDLGIFLQQDVDHNAVHRPVPRYVGQTRRQV